MTTPNQHWSNYWQQGHITSFGQSFSGNYTGVLKEVWQDIIVNLPDNFAVLDLATGNGAIPQLIADHFAEDKKYGQVIGVDLATVNDYRPKNSEYLAVELIGGVDCAKLSFPDDHFDIVTSQFGIEYSDLNKSLVEAIRVLKPGGKLVIIGHHEDSLIINRNRDILQVISHPKAAQVIDCLAGLANAMIQVRTQQDLEVIKTSKECESLRISLNEALSILAQISQQGLEDSELLTYVSQYFKQGLGWPLDKRQSFINHCSEQQLALKTRLGELIAAAQSQETLLATLQPCLTNKVTLASLDSLVSDDKQILAWRLQVNKSS